MASKKKWKLSFKALGFACYRDYLSSKRWHSIRSRVALRDKRKCQCCLKTASCVHHLDYTLPTMTGARLSGLISLCEECHSFVEFTDVGEKLDNVELKAQHLNSRMICARGTSLSQWRRMAQEIDKASAAKKKSSINPVPAPQEKSVAIRGSSCDRKVDRRRKKERADEQRKSRRLDIDRRTQLRDKKLEAWKNMASWERAAYLNAASNP